ncbi:MAG: hypothetical protein RIC06_23025 [Cyclobacteriaceae bacterium]
MKFVDELRKEKESLKKRLEAIDVLLSSYDIREEEETETNVSKAQSNNGSDSSFPAEASYLEKVLYVIKRENRFLHNNEIYNVLKQYDDKEEQHLKRRISAVLSHAKKDVDNLTNYRVGNSIKNTFWGSKDWLDNNGEIRKEHMYDIKVIGKEPKKVTL